MKISEILTPDPQCISPDPALTKAAQTMKLLDVGMLPVCDRDRLTGTVTVLEFVSERGMTPR